MVAWFFLTQTVEHRKMLVDLRNIGFYGQYVFVIWNLSLYSAQIAFQLMLTFRQNDTLTEIGIILQITDAILAMWGLKVITDKKFTSFIQENHMYRPIYDIIRSMEFVRLALYVGVGIAAFVLVLIAIVLIMVGREAELAERQRQFRRLPLVK